MALGRSKSALALAALILLFGSGDGSRRCHWSGHNHQRNLPGNMCCWRRYVHGGSQRHV